MFTLQLKFESRRLMRNPIFWIILVFISVSIGFGAYNGAQRVSEQQKIVSDYLTSQRTSLEEQKILADSISRGLKDVDRWWTDPTNAMIVGGLWGGGWTTVAEPSQQSLIATGMSDIQPYAWRLNLVEVSAQGGSELENPVNLAAGPFDLAFVIAFLLPLMVIAFSFNLISGDQEQGAYALHYSQPVAIGSLYINKMLARFVLLAGITLAISLAALVFAGISLISGAALTICGVVLLYLLFWFLTTMGVNLLGGSSARNALLCVGLWIAFALVIPSLVNLSAQTIYTVPSKAGLYTELRDLEAKLDESKDQRLDQFFRDHPEAVRKPDSLRNWTDNYKEDFLLLDSEQMLRDSISERYNSATARQTGFTNDLSLLSPVLSVQRQLIDLAQTSRDAYSAIDGEVDELQKDWSTWFLTKFNADESLTQSDYDEFMQFPEKVSTAELPVNYRGTLWLIIQCLIVTIWVYMALRKFSN